MNIYSKFSNGSGLEYLESIEHLLPFGISLDVWQNLRDRHSIYEFIGGYIEGVNDRLRAYISVCDDCFYPEDRRKIDIFALPLPDSCGLDGLCNLDIYPITILVDVGRVAPADWLSLVVHEYAHAHLGKPGHDRDFANVLSHLCLGLGISPPIDRNEDILRHFPPYSTAIDSLAFWRGEIAF